MNADLRKSREELDHLSKTAIGCAYKVANTLGFGFLEKIYRNALAYELARAGLQVDSEKPVQVLYDGFVVGNYYADIIVENSLIIELKTAEAIDDAYVAQCLNYLKATGLRLGLVLNFSPHGVQIRRVVHDF